jgi:glycine betaine/proline transport system permease protein
LTWDKILNPFQNYTIPLGDWVDAGIQWLVTNFRPFFQGLRWPIDKTLTGVEAFFQAIPPLVFLVLVGFIAWQLAGKKVAAQMLFWLAFIGFIGAWEGAMTTLSLVVTAVLFCVLVGIPLGILAARSDRFESIMRPGLDAMQTTPAFVYLVPVVMLFGIGNVPGIVVTIIFALPPLIRLTNLGIRQVPGEMIEASRAFGASPWQELVKVQLPVAAETIMAGINQTLMLALSMVVIASMISVGGLGQMVLRGIGRLDMGLAAVGGIGIVVLAIIIDRLTQSIRGPSARRERGKWYEHGPIGLFRNMFRSGETPAQAG